ncbi:MAG: hypothetical protein QXE99_07160 [Acidilobaceae archaeon]
MSLIRVILSYIHAQYTPLLSHSPALASWYVDARFKSSSQGSKPMVMNAILSRAFAL